MKHLFRVSMCVLVLAFTALLVHAVPTFSLVNIPGTIKSSFSNGSPTAASTWDADIDLTTDTYVTADGNVEWDPAGALKFAHSSSKAKDGNDFSCDNSLAPDAWWDGYLSIQLKGTAEIPTWVGGAGVYNVTTTIEAKIEDNSVPAMVPFIDKNPKKTVLRNPEQSVLVSDTVTADFDYRYTGGTWNQDSLEFTYWAYVNVEVYTEREDVVAEGTAGLLPGSVPGGWITGYDWSGFPVLSYPLD